MLSFTYPSVVLLPKKSKTSITATRIAIKNANIGKIAEITKTKIFFISLFLNLLYTIKFSMFTFYSF